MISNSIINPTISILMPVYNAEQFLFKTLNSLIDQSFTNWECICVDDGSTDSSLEILHEFASRDGRFSVYTQPNSGSAGKPRNKALDMAKGDFIFELDADDTITPDVLEKVYTRSIETGADYIIPILASYFPESETIKAELTGFVGDTTAIISGREAFEASILWKISGLGLVKTVIARSERYVEINLYGDELATRRRFLHCQTVAFSTGTYLYTQHQQSVTKVISPKRFEYYINNNTIISILCEHNFPEPVIQTYANHFAKMLFQGTFHYLKVRSQFSSEQIQYVTEILTNSRKKISIQLGNRISMGKLWLMLSSLALTPIFPVKLVFVLNKIRRQFVKKRL